MAQVSVTINGRSYRMACNEGEEERLLGLADQFNAYVSELKGSFGEIGDQRLTVMAGIMVTDELAELKSVLARQKAELEQLRGERKQAASGQSEDAALIAAHLNQAAERIEGLSQKLNRTLHPVAGAGETPAPGSDGRPAD